MVAIDTLQNNKIGILQDQRNTYLERNYSLTIKKEYRFVDTTNDVVIKHDPFSFFSFTVSNAIKVILRSYSIIAYLCDSQKDNHINISFLTVYCYIQ